MSKMIYERIIVIGYGVVTGEVVQYVIDKKEQYNYTITYIEHEVHPFNNAKKIAINNEIEYLKLEDKTELTEYLLNQNENVLIISASNNYLFPKELVDKPNTTIINFHNALLPKYPGRNAPSWVIFDEQRETGITWHYVTSGIDEGNIIIQKKCEISEDIKAYELVSMLMHLASEAFKECLDLVVCDQVVSRKQDFSDERKIYKSWEVPGNGTFELSDNPKYIYRLLRSMDYGKNDIFPAVTTKHNGNMIRIRRYKVVLAEKQKDMDRIINISIDRQRVLQLKYDMVYPSDSWEGADNLNYL